MALRVSFLLLFEPISRPDLAYVDWLESQLKRGRSGFQSIIVMQGVHKHGIRHLRISVVPQPPPIRQGNIAVLPWSAERRFYNAILPTVRTEKKVVIGFCDHTVVPSIYEEAAQRP